MNYRLFPHTSAELAPDCITRVAGASVLPRVGEQIVLAKRYLVMRVVHSPHRDDSAADIFVEEMK